jgi:hypothetical protein
VQCESIHVNALLFFGNILVVSDFKVVVFSQNLQVFGETRLFAKDRLATI